MRTEWAAGLLCCLAALPVGAMDVGFEPRPGAQLPLEARLHDETDHMVKLGATMSGGPWILVLGYFSCPNLCDTVRADLIGALKDVPADVSYHVAAVSVDTHERVADVNQARIHDAMYQSRVEAWRYLRADARTLEALTAAVGFKDRYDSSIGQIAHPAGLVFVTPQGKISSYLFGVGYGGKAVTRALEQAANGHIDTAPPEAIALLCFDYDATTGRYTFAIIKLLRAVAFLTLVVVAGGLVTLFLKPRVPA